MYIVNICVDITPGETIFPVKVVEEAVEALEEHLEAAETLPR